MDITISHPDFKTQLLELRVSGYFSAPRILLNGAQIRRTNGAYTVLNDVGQEVMIRMNSSLFYRLPELLIEQDGVPLVGKSGWTQFSGWRNTVPAQWLAASLRMASALVRVKRLNKSM